MALSELTRDEIAGHSELLGDEYYEVLAEGSWLDSKLSAGGTASARLEEQFATAREALAKIGSGGG